MTEHVVREVSLEGVPEFPTGPETAVGVAGLVGILGHNFVKNPVAKHAIFFGGWACIAVFASRAKRHEEAFHLANPEIRANATAH